MRALKRVVTALLVLAMLLGPLAAVVVWTTRHRWSKPTAATVAGWLRPAEAMIIAAVVAAALVWLLLASYLMRQLVRVVVRRRRLRNLRLPTPAQMTAGSMAGLAALTLPAATATDPAATAAAPAPADPDNGQPPTTPTDHTATDGITLPGGSWLPYPSALAVITLTGALWARRRRDYTPELGRIGTHHHDADLQPLPATARAIAEALAEARTSQSRPGPLSLDRLPTGLLHLHGPGAHAAARGLLVTAALTHATHPANTRPVTIRYHDWQRLLPELHPETPLAGLIHPTSDAEPQRATHDPSTPQTEERGCGTPTVIVLNEPGIPAATWHVDHDGTTTGTGLATSERLCTLDQQAAVDLLTLVHQPRSTATRVTPPPPHPPTAADRMAGKPAPARLTLLGDCTLTIGRQPIHLSRTAGRQVLAYLALHPEGATRTALITAIWPKLPPATITQRLHTTISDLRRQIQPATGNPIIHNADTYRLNPEAIDTDLREWRTALAKAATAVSPITRTDTCRHILNLYKGELAPGQPWPWIEPARQAARRDALDACIHLADHSPPTEAPTWLQHAATIDPYNTAIQQRIAQLRKISPTLLKPAAPNE